MFQPGPEDTTESAGQRRARAALPSHLTFHYWTGREAGASGHGRRLFFSLLEGASYTITVELTTAVAGVASRLCQRAKGNSFTSPCFPLLSFCHLPSLSWACSLVLNELANDNNIVRHPIDSKTTPTQTASPQSHIPSM